MPPRSLHVEVPHVDGPPAGLADQGVGLDQQLRKRLAAFGPIAERQAALAKLLVVELHQFRFQGADLGHELRPIRQPPAVCPAGKRRKRRSENVEKTAHEGRRFFRVFVMVRLLNARTWPKAEFEGDPSPRSDPGLIVDMLSRSRQVPCCQDFGRCRRRGRTAVTPWEYGRHWGRRQGPRRRSSRAGPKRSLRQGPPGRPQRRWALPSCLQARTASIRFDCHS